PATAEEIDGIRDCALAQTTGARLHVAHVSARGTVGAVRQAKAAGLPVTCEIAPHHWTLTDEEVASYDTNTKVNPPLRSRDHVEALLEALRDRTIDAIATDHAPHHADEKALEFDEAPFGIIGLETGIGLAFELVHQGVISLERLVEMCATNPARIFSLKERGSFVRLAHADVTILDPECEWVFDVSHSKSKSRNTPFHGRTMRGAAVATIVSGRLVYLHPDYGRLIQKAREASVWG
ncbi:MAG TPA: amidohydrolase family protein, partial [Pyrinomonadaceae bacterium]|nr:amidohydrolase family protein [Pyrinomonadaceae bacterium]